MIPKRPPRREVKDIMSWLGCWIAYCQVVLAFFPSPAVDLLKRLDLIVRTHGSFPSADIWLRYDRGFLRKAACSPVPLDWGATDLEVFHQAYASRNVFQPPPSSPPPFLWSADTLRRAKPAAPPQDPRSAVLGTIGVVPGASLNANDVTNATGVTARIAVCPSAATDRRSRSRSCSPLVVRPTSLHVLLRLLRPLCLPPSPVLSSTLLW